MRISFGVKALLVVCALGAEARAGTEEEVEQLGAEGMQAYQAGRLVEAQTKLQRAFTLSHYPTVGVWLARTLEAQGRPAEAFDVYQSVENKPLAPGAPRLFQDAQNTARTERTRLSKLVGIVQVQLQGEPPEKVQLTVNGQPREYPTNGIVGVAPGSAVIEASASGKKASQSVTVAAAESVLITLDLTSHGPTSATTAPVATASLAPPVAAAPAATPPAPADQKPAMKAPVAPPDHGFELGGRLVFGVPFGKAYDSSDYDDHAFNALGLGLDANYRLNPHWALGGFLQLAWGLGGDKLLIGDCTISNVECSMFTGRLGIQAQYHFSDGPGGGWAGASFGYEWLHDEIHNTYNQVTVKMKSSGLELLGLQGGYDWQLGPMALGPAATFTVGRYGDPSISGTELNTTLVEDGAFHFWLFVGARATYLIGK